MSYGDLIEAQIDVGDEVVVITIWSEVPAIVIGIPAGPGDLWQFQRPDGSVYALNPYSSGFVRIERR